MPEAIFWLGDASESSARVCLRGDTPGVYSVRTATQRKQVALDPAVGYGVGYVDLTDLEPDATTDFSVYLGTTQLAAGKARTMPPQGASFYVAYFSCMRQNVDPVALYNLVDQFDVRAAFSLGDMPYTDAAMEARFAGSALAGSYTAPTDPNTWHAQLLALHRDYPAYRYLAERVPVYKMWDDHECLCNDFDHDLTNVNAQFTGNGGSAFGSQALLDAAWLVARTAWNTWACGNPSTTWPYAAAHKPSSAAAGTAAANYAPQYFHKDVGGVRFLVPDLMSHLCAISKADSGTLIEEISTAKTRLGKPQIRGLKSMLMSSPYAFNMLMSTKVTKKAQATSDNHGWSDFVTERNHLIEWISRNARGVVWTGGDVHTPFIINDEFHAQINGCPLSWAEQTAGSVNLGSGYTEGVVWKSQGYNLDPIYDSRNGIGLMKVTPNYVDHSIADERGRLFTTWRQYPNQNTISRIF